MAIVVIAIVVGAGFYTGYIKLPAGSTVTTTTTTPGPITSSAYCQAAAGLVPLPGNNQCYATQVKLQISLTNLLGNALTASKYSIKYWQNVGTPATFTGNQISGGTWQQIDLQKAGAAPTSATTSNGWPTGLQVAVQVCENQTPACAAGDYTGARTDIVCPLPSLAPTASGSALQTPCAPGPGNGVVPFSAPSQNPPVTINFNLPIPANFGSADDGFNTNSPNCIAGTLANSTQTPAAPCSAAGTETVNTKNCTTGSPCIGAGATSGTTGLTGRFTIAVNLQTGGANAPAAPATPYSIGWFSYSPVDPALQTGVNARGQLVTALFLEIKATTGTDMCFTQSTFGGVSPIVVPKSGTDVIYVWPIADANTLVARDASGTVYSSGTLQGTLAIDCSAIYGGGSTDVNSLTFNEYQALSLTVLQNPRSYGSLNPEATAMISSSSAAALNDVYTIKQ